MQHFFKFLTVSALAICPGVLADTYSTDATMAYQKEEGIINVTVRVSRLLEQDGKVTEQLIAEPRVRTSPGVQATAKTGLQPGHPEYEQTENVSVIVSWPYPNESGTAFCAVTITRGEMIVSKSRLQLKLEGPGRVPLVLGVEDIDSKSVRVGDKEHRTFVLLEFVHKSEAEVKRLAIDNYGNAVQIRDSEGHLIERARAFGRYKKMGIALDFESEDEAKKMVSLLTKKKSE